jgi:hypothetical protein
MRFLVLTYCLIQVALSFAQSDKVKLEIAPRTLEIGESFTITITSKVQGDVDIENLPGSFVQDYSIQQGQYPEMDHNTGKVTQTYFVSYSGMITKAGDYEIGPAFVKNTNKVYKSNKVKIKVGKKVAMSSGQVTASQLNDPAFGVIEANKKSIYEGEPVLLAAKIYSYYDPSTIGGYQSYDLNSTCTKHAIGNNNNIKVGTEVVKGKRLYAFSYDKNVIFPDGVGKFHIDPFKLKLYQGYKSYPITSSGLILEIKPLPANPPADFVGGVGDFRVLRHVDTTIIKQGDVFKVFITISGIGNLQNLLEPKLNLPSGFIIYGDPVLTENFTTGIHGAEGEVQYEFNIQVTKYGDIKLPATTISYFDPLKEKYVQSTSEETELKIEKNKKFVTQDESDALPVEDVVADRDLTPRKNSEIVSGGTLFGSTLFWTGVGLPFSLAFVLLFFKNQQSKNVEQKTARAKTRERANKLVDQKARIKLLASGGDDHEFYSLIELSIKEAFAVATGVTEERMINKSEILSFVNDKPNLKTQLESIFNQCDQFRYGAVADVGAKDQLAQLTEHVIDEIVG